MGLQIMCFGWLKSCICQLACNLHRELEESPCVPPWDSIWGTAYEVLVEHCPSSRLDPALVLRSRGMAPECACDL